MTDKHKHADLMLQYALDAVDTDKPWKRWQVTVKAGWKSFHHEFSFNPHREYRRHPDAPPVPWHLLRKHFEDYCDGHCTWSDHAEGCLRKEPTPKPVDLSVCIESGIDMECSVTGNENAWWVEQGGTLKISDAGCYWADSIEDWVGYCRPRMNRWHSWQGGDCPVPEGFIGDILLRNGVQSKNKKLCCWKWVHSGNYSDIIAFRVTGLADGYCLPWED